MKLFAGTSNPSLATFVAHHLQIPLGAIEITRFIDSECRVRVLEDVAGEDVYVVQSLSQIADQHLVELCLIGQALKNLNAKRVVAVIPWMGYSKQDKEFRKGEAVSAQLVAKVIESAGFDGVITVELHSENLVPYFKIPVVELSSHELLGKSVDVAGKSDTVVASPDQGGKSRSGKFAKQMGLPIVYLQKERSRETGSVAVVGISAPVTGKNVIIFDDIINTGSTAIKTSEFLKKQGAGAIYFLATHAVFAGDATGKLARSSIDHVTVTDTIAIPQEKLFDKLSVVSMAPLLAEAIGNS